MHGKSYKRRLSSALDGRAGMCKLMLVAEAEMQDGAFLLRNADLDVAEGDSAVMRLEEDVAFLKFARAGAGFVFAGGYKVAPFRGTPLVFHGFPAVEPVGDVVFLGKDERLVPLADWHHLFVIGGGDEIGKGADGAVANITGFRIRVAGVVEDLELGADGRGTERMDGVIRRLDGSLKLIHIRAGGCGR
jgi:hypothetical protein